MLSDEGESMGRGSHILASVSRVRVAARKAQPIVVTRPPRPMWGFTYTKFPRPGESKFQITDEVRFTTFCLVIVGTVVVVGFLAADFGLNRIKVRDVLESGGHGLAVLIGGIFSILACVLSFIQIRSHKKNWTHPPSQIHVVRILYMVPIYAISAWGSLTFLNMSSYIDFVRGVYEAYVIYTFMILLTKYLGGHNGVVEWMKYKPPQPWPAPLWCLKPVVPDSTYLYYLKYGALQYTIITPICSLASVILTSFGAFEEGVIEVDNGYPYVAFVMNAAQLVSLYCLVWLYMCLKNELAPFGPLAKFMVVKAVVFLTFWQGIALAFAVHFGWITQTDNFSVGEVQVGMQDFLVCIEMFIAACTHKYTFGSETYADGTMRLIMEQRAMYLAEISYKRGVEAQKAAAVATATPDEAAAIQAEEETEEERVARQEAMAAIIRRNMDEDTEGDVLFDEDLVDWTSGTALPKRNDQLTGGIQGVQADEIRAAIRPSAYDYVYAYELERQRPEGVALDEDEEEQDLAGMGGDSEGYPYGSPSSARSPGTRADEEDADEFFSSMQEQHVQLAERVQQAREQQLRQQQARHMAPAEEMDEEYATPQPAPAPAQPTTQAKAKTKGGRVPPVQQQRPQQAQGRAPPPRGANRGPPPRASASAPPAAHVVDMESNPFDDGGGFI